MSADDEGAAPGGESRAPVAARSRRRWAPAVIGAALALLLGVLSLPRLPQLAAEREGDPVLVAEVAAAIPSAAHDRLSVVVIDGEESREAQFGADGGTEYEIGSVSKTVVAALLAEAIRRGEVAESTRLGELLDVGDGPVARLTLLQLATHTSGLPRVASTPGTLLRGAISGLRGTDPYGESLDELEEEARGAALGEEEWSYSNLGFALLGQALAAAAGLDYPELVEERVFGPLGMADSRVPTSAAELGDGASTGYASGGRPAGPWTMGAYAPAGAVRSTSDDLALFARALLDGTAPGVEALEPRAAAGEDERIGYAWYTTEDGIVWHNGMTGGFASFIGLDPAADRAVVVLSDTAVPVDGLALRLLREEEEG